MKTALIISLCCVCIVLILLFTSTRTIVDTDTITINQKGHKFIIYDHLNRKAYSLVIRHNKRSEAEIQPSVLILTDTIRIDRIIGGFQVISNGMVYQITRKKGVF